MEPVAKVSASPSPVNTPVVNNTAVQMPSNQSIVPQSGISGGHKHGGHIHKSADDDSQL